MTFKSELREVSKLVENLETEQICLINHNLGKIQVLNEEKYKILNKLSTYSHRRYRWLAKAGFSPNESGMCDWLLESDEPTGQEAWLVTQRMLVKAKVLNHTNLLLINQSSQYEQVRAGRMKMAS
jgi:flagellar biosynthesis/type III secretory pathway chaperone